MGMSILQEQSLESSQRTRLLKKVCRIAQRSTMNRDQRKGKQVMPKQVIFLGQINNDCSVVDGTSIQNLTILV